MGYICLYGDAFWVVYCPWNFSKVHEQGVGTIHWTFCSSVLGWLLNVWELGDAYLQFEMTVLPVGDGECFFESWKMSFRMHGKNPTWPHCFTRWDSHRLHQDWKGEIFSFSQNKEIIASIFGASGLLPKVHQGVCNLGISPHQIFQTRVKDYGGRKDN
jgi:hypothetical protein